MSEVFSIKTEPFDNDYKQEDSKDSTNDTNTLSYNSTKLENFTNMGINIKKDEPDLDKMEEFLPETIDESTITVIKEEDVDEMDEFLPEDSASIYSWKSNDRKEVITHDVLHQQQVTQQHLITTTTKEISLPKLEIMDVHTDEEDSKDLETNGDTDVNSADNNEKRSVILSARVHKCELCSKSYTYKKYLKAHMRQKHTLSTNAQYICKICNQRCTTQVGLELHSIRKHPETQRPTENKCEICGSCYAESKSLRAHIRSKHPASIDSNYICEICNDKFTTQIGLDRHSFRAHPETQTPTEHKCEICGSCYKMKQNLTKHMRKEHSLIDKEYICEICHTECTTEKGLDRHFNRMHTEAHSTFKYKCELCARSYTDIKSLRSHIRDKHPLSIDSEYMCEICNTRFTSQIGLDRHYDRMHPGAHSTQTPDKKHKCEICGICFRGAFHLRTHMRKKHSSFLDSEYICEICNVKFTTQLGLDRHSYTKHPETQPPLEHKCEICGNCYRRSDSLREHVAIKHLESSVYICEICHKRFATQLGLDRHCKKMH
ncbi:zinc finger Y-chromosomal protein 1-like isoform X1 [Musca autumnalis]|uniref:zinc finger Y-chromosomal protein 1-like isoform X1 n=1 Tax=Musca autumnalis TaxID=221902 RepID=UPI003CF56272